jgi:hypothetical protein
VSLIAGIGSFFAHIVPGVGGFTVALIAVITGFMARQQIRETREVGLGMPMLGLSSAPSTSRSCSCWSSD